MSRKRKENRWDDIDGKSALVIPYSLLRHPNCIRLGPYANKMLFDLARQYTGFNNGWMSSAWTLMKECGWNSSHTVQKAMLELEHYRLLVRTQHGALNKTNLHAFTWRRIDECPSKMPNGMPKRRLEIAPTLSPSNAWKDEQPDFVMPAKKGRHRSRKPHLKVA